ncbi:argininosuccinate synthase domain-containing protein [Staphylococcus aureus]|uniref:argininosuccinate synthase domain-containing protein n=1 Tax=Staphylococcus aureus TaxID=1280 RepID=UPI003D671986
MKEKIVLAYSGGLDTSVAVQWLIDKGYDVVACCLDVGEGKAETNGYAFSYIKFPLIA